MYTLTNFLTFVFTAASLVVIDYVYGIDMFAFFLWEGESGEDLVNLHRLTLAFLLVPFGFYYVSKRIAVRLLYGKITDMRYVEDKEHNSDFFAYMGTRNTVFAKRTIYIHVRKNGFSEPLCSAKELGRNIQKSFVTSSLTRRAFKSIVNGYTSSLEDIDFFVIYNDSGKANSLISQRALGALAGSIFLSEDRPPIRKEDIRLLFVYIQQSSI